LQIDLNVNVSKLVDTYFSPEEADLCRPYILDPANLQLTGSIGGSIFCEVHAGLLGNSPVAIKRLRPHHSTTVLMDLMNEISFMSRFA
jgi:hypothetical protein